MTDSRLKVAERRLQPLFSKLLIAGAFFLLLASDSRPELPDRTPMSERLVPVRYAPVVLGKAEGGVRVTGAWIIEADDPRLAGLSGLAVLDTRTLVAVSDSGVLIDLPKPGSSAPGRFRDLIGGPGFPTFKKYRDSEALLVRRDSRTPGSIVYEISFEHRHALIAYSQAGRRLFRVPLPRTGWPANKGAEAIAPDGQGGQLIFAEQGRELLVRTRSGIVRRPLAGATGGVADAVLLPDGRIVVAVREVGLTGLRNRLAWLEREGGGYRLRNFATLPLGPLDNVEGLAAEPQSGVGAVLWAVTDNDGWRRTLLLRMEIAPSLQGRWQPPSG